MTSLKASNILSLCLAIVLFLSAAGLANVPGKKQSFTIGYDYKVAGMFNSNSTAKITPSQSGIYLAGESPITENITLVSNSSIGNSTLRYEDSSIITNYSGLYANYMIGVKIEW